MSDPLVAFVLQHKLLCVMPLASLMLMLWPFIFELKNYTRKIIVSYILSCVIAVLIIIDFALRLFYYQGSN